MYMLGYVPMDVHMTMKFMEYSVRVLAMGMALSPQMPCQLNNS